MAVALSKKGMKELWRRYKRNKTAVICLIILLLVFIIAISSPLLTPYSPLRTGVGPPYHPPSNKYLMGTDDLGRDIFSGVLYGARVILWVGFFAAGISIIIGTTVGTIAAYFGGVVDDVLMRILEILLVLPKFVFALVLVSLFRGSQWLIIFIIGALTWPTVGRVVRSEVLSLKERRFVEAARSLGSGGVDVMFSEIMPNALPSIMVIASLQVARSILLEAGLSFLGAGDPNVLSWGLMLYKAQNAIFMGAWWMTFFPGLAIFLTILSFNVVGDGLNDALNPKLKEA